LAENAGNFIGDDLSAGNLPGQTLRNLQGWVDGFAAKRLEASNENFHKNAPFAKQRKQTELQEDFSWSLVLLTKV
jgi:hypothetical protein